MNSNTPIWKIKYKQKFDWWKFTIHFIIGAVLGGLIGLFPHHLSIDLYMSIDKTEYILLIICSAIFFGLLAGIFGDKFWNFFFTK